MIDLFPFFVGFSTRYWPRIGPYQVYRHPRTRKEQKKNKQNKTKKHGTRCTGNIDMPTDKSRSKTLAIATCTVEFKRMFLDFKTDRFFIWEITDRVTEITRRPFLCHFLLTELLIPFLLDVFIQFYFWGFLSAFLLCSGVLDSCGSSENGQTQKRK